MNQQIKNQHDLKQYEQNFPLNLPSSTYQMLCDSEATVGDKKAIPFDVTATPKQNRPRNSKRH